MVSSSEIKRLSDQVKVGRDAFKNKNSAGTPQINKINASWKGEISESFKDANKKTQTKIGKLLTDMGSLSSRLNTLYTAIKREEAEKLKETKK